MTIDCGWMRAIVTAHAFTTQRCDKRIRQETDG